MGKEFAACEAEPTAIAAYLESRLALSEKLSRSRPLAQLVAPRPNSGRTLDDQQAEVLPEVRMDEAKAATTGT